MTPESALDADGFHLRAYHDRRPFSSFLPGVAGAGGKPMWVFYTNRGQCIASFGVRDRNGAMLEFHPANKAYALTSLLGFRSFLRIGGAVHEPFQPGAPAGVRQRLTVRPEEIEIEEVHDGLGLRLRIVTFTLPNETLPALVRRVTLENLGPQALSVDVLDGLPQVVPYGLDELPLKRMSRTMEAFAEVCHVEDALPLYRLKVEPSDRPEVRWIEGGYFAFTQHDGRPVPVVVDPELVFGMDSSLRRPEAFVEGRRIDPLAARCETMTACAFAQLTLWIEPGGTASWDSYFGQASSWEAARGLRERVAVRPGYAADRRAENCALIAGIGERFPLLAGPPELDAYTRQAFLDNTLRGGLPVVIDGPRGPRVFHTFTRKHGDMERDYNAFELAPSYWSQGNGNFRDVNQNRRCENFTFAGVDAANIETFFELIQLDGNNPLVIRAERFRVEADAQADLFGADWPPAAAERVRALLAQPFSPGELHEALLGACGGADAARPWFERVLGRADKLQEALHGEGYWVDHWIYNLDLLESHVAMYPDRQRQLLFERNDFGYHDSDHVVQPRDRKYVQRTDGTVRQLGAVVVDADKARLIARRTESPHAMRAGHGSGAIYRTTLLAKIVNLLAVKASLFDPFGIGLEMEADKPGWCDALNGLPGLFGSSTHEAFALWRWVGFVRRAVDAHLQPAESPALPVEVERLVRKVTEVLATADPADFFPSWDRLATAREAFRAETLRGIAGDEAALPADALRRFLDMVDRVLRAGLARAVDAAGLPVSYYTHDLVAFDVLPAVAPVPGDDGPATVHVRARRFEHKPLPPFLEGAVHALRSCPDVATARRLHAAVRASALHDAPLGMYRVNAPLDAESFDIGRSRVFSPGWLENESIFLHMHYKFLLETLRSGLAEPFFDDLRRGLVAFHDPAVYGRSPLENSSFIASSRFPDARVHGAGFVARLSGATAEWISMVLHMGLGAAPFRVVDGALRFEPQPTLADWLFTSRPSGGFGAGSFGFKLFGSTWIVYDNPSRRSTFGAGAVRPQSFALHRVDGTQLPHEGAWLPEALARELRDGRLARVVIALG